MAAWVNMIDKARGIPQSNSGSRYRSRLIEKSRQKRAGSSINGQPEQMFSQKFSLINCSSVVMPFLTNDIDYVLPTASLNKDFMVAPNSRLYYKCSLCVHV